jgi:nicotinate phosphoribosyltransferase
VAIEDETGSVLPRIKISENPDKITNPHFKKVYRIFRKATGKAIADQICVWDETIDESQPLELFDPKATWKRNKVSGFYVQELQIPIFAKESWSISSRNWLRCGAIAQSSWIHSG